jgi:hypothetical protein
VFGLVANLVISVVLTLVLRLAGSRDRADETSRDDYFERRAEPARAMEPQLQP